MAKFPKMHPFICEKSMNCIAKPQKSRYNDINYGRCALL